MLAAVNYRLTHNGIIENHQALRALLEQEGHLFLSDRYRGADNLIEKYYRGDLLAAVRRRWGRLRGLMLSR